MEEFHSKWEAMVENESTVAEGTWFYQDKIPYSAKLVRQHWNYGSRDLPLLDEILQEPFHDYIDYNISDEGVIYFWVFEGQAARTKSPTFATYFQARDHINTYGYKYEIKWL